MTMDIGFGPDEFDPDNPDGRIPDGKYHIVVQDCNEHYNERSGVFDYEICAGTKPGQEGQTGKEWIAKSAKASERRALLFIAAGMTTREELKRAKADNKERLSFKFDDLIGRQFIVELKTEEGRDFPSITYRGFWHLDDPKVADVPKNEGMAAQMRNGTTTGRTSEEQLSGTDF